MRCEVTHYFPHFFAMTMSCDRQKHQQREPAENETRFATSFRGANNYTSRLTVAAPNIVAIVAILEPLSTTITRV